MAAASALTARTGSGSTGIVRPARWIAMVTSAAKYDVGLSGTVAHAPLKGQG